MDNPYNIHTLFPHENVQLSGPKLKRVKGKYQYLVNMNNDVFLHTCIMRFFDYMTEDTRFRTPGRVEFIPFDKRLYEHVKHGIWNIIGRNPVTLFTRSSRHRSFRVKEIESLGLYDDQVVELIDIYKWFRENLKSVKYPESINTIIDIYQRNYDNSEGKLTQVWSYVNHYKEIYLFNEDRIKESLKKRSDKISEYVQRQDDEAKEIVKKYSLDEVDSYIQQHSLQERCPYGIWIDNDLYGLGELKDTTELFKRYAKHREMKGFREHDVDSITKFIDDGKRILVLGIQPFKTNLFQTPQWFIIDPFLSRNVIGKIIPDLTWNLMYNRDLLVCASKEDMIFPVLHLLTKTPSRFTHFEKSTDTMFLGTIIVPFIDDRKEIKEFPPNMSVSEKNRHRTSKHIFEKFEFYVFLNDGEVQLYDHRGNLMYPGYYKESERIYILELNLLIKLGMNPCLDITWIDDDHYRIYFSKREDTYDVLKEKKRNQYNTKVLSNLKDLIPVNIKKIAKLPHILVDVEYLPKLLSQGSFLYTIDSSKYYKVYRPKKGVTYYTYDESKNSISIEEHKIDVETSKKYHTDDGKVIDAITLAKENAKILDSLTSLPRIIFKKHISQVGGDRSSYGNNVYQIMTGSVKYRWDIKFSRIQDLKFDKMTYPIELNDKLVNIERTIHNKNKNDQSKFFKLILSTHRYHILTPNIPINEIKDKFKILYSRNKVPTYHWFNEKTPVSPLYYEYILGRYSSQYIEVIKTFDLLKGKSKILSFSKNMGFMEIISHQLEMSHYKKRLDKDIHHYQLKYYDDLPDDIRYEKVVQEYGFKNTLVDIPLDNSYINKIAPDIDRRYDLVHTDSFIYDKHLPYAMREVYNHTHTISLVLLSLISLKNGGTYIFYVWENKSSIINQIIYILTTLFEKSYYLKVEQNFGRYGFQYVFVNYKRSNKVLKRFKQLNKRLYETDPSGGFNYNVLDKDNRVRYNITKKIDKNTPKRYLANIISFIKEPTVFFNQIKKTVTMKLQDYMELLDKVNQRIDSRDREKFDKELYQHQLYSAIDYAKRFDVRLKSSLDTKTFYDEFGQSILEEAYGLDNAYQYQFKKHKETKFISIYPTYDSSPERLEKDATRWYMSARAIDYRPIEDYYKARDLTRYYRKTDRKKRHKNMLREGTYHEFSISRDVTQITNAQFVSQAWLKMYEMINIYPLFDKEKRTVKTFHLCEAPGAFILAINHYLKTKTKVDSFDWYAQSLNPNSELAYRKYGDDIFGKRDETGLQRRYPDRWIWGKDGSGDITNPDNIKSYKKYCEDIDFMTIDCGLASTTKGLYKVNYAQVLFLLSNLPQGKNMVMKLTIPMLPAMKVSLIYMLYVAFERLHIYKSLQNPYAREFYVIGLNYENVVSKKEIDKMFKFLKKYDEEKSIFCHKKIPKSFMVQLEKVSKDLTNKFVFNMERRIYYVDNLEKIDKEHFKLLEKTIDERNKEWISTFKLKRIKDIDKLV